MPDIKDSIRKKLSEEVGETTVSHKAGWDNPKYDQLEPNVREVMSAYQNANKWLDTLKEHILINLECPYFSNVVHQLAHTMPGRFDQFGDILHTENLLIPYPSTAEWTSPIGDISSCISIVYSILDDIKRALTNFKRAAEICGCPAMSISCDVLLTDISGEYEFYYRAEGLLKYYGNNLAQWDKRCYEYYNTKDSLI